MLQRLNPSRKWEFFFLSAHTSLMKAASIIDIFTYK